MPDRKISTGTSKTWKNSGGDYAITLASLADTKARQGVKGDLGELRAYEWAIELYIETGGSAPTAGETIELYWSSSNSATAGTGNDGGASGTDAAYKDAEESEWLKQLILIGVLVLTNDASTVQKQTFKFIPPTRYGMPIVRNLSGQTLETNDDEHKIVFIPQIDNIA